MVFRSSPFSLYCDTRCLPRLSALKSKTRRGWERFNKAYWRQTMASILLPYPNPGRKTRPAYFWEGGRAAELPNSTQYQQPSKLQRAGKQAPFFPSLGPALTQQRLASHKSCLNFGGVPSPPLLLLLHLLLSKQLWKKKERKKSSAHFNCMSTYACMYLIPALPSRFPT